MRVLWLIFLFVGFATSVQAELVTPAAASAGGIFAQGSAVSKDEKVELSWSFAAGVAESGAVAGVRVHRLLDGDRIRYRVDPLALVQDAGEKTRLKVSGLDNGSRVIFVASAYDSADKIVGQMLFFGFPGSRAKDVPPKVKNLYAASGHNAISVFWDRLEQVNIAGYEVLRRRVDETVFTKLGRMNKVAYVDGKTIGAPLNAQLPEVQPGIFRDRMALPGLSYVYQVRAFDTDGKLGPGMDTEPVSLDSDRSPLPEEVLLLTRWDSSDSKKVARHYAARRGVPEKNILELSFFKGKKYRNSQILEDVREHLLDNGLAGKIRVIVPSFNMPLRDSAESLDSRLVDLFDRYTWGRVMGTPNPVFGQNAHHDPSLGLYLVSRLDGPTPEIAMSLVDKALEAEQGVTARSGAAFFSNPDFKKECLKAAERHGVKVHSKDTSFTKENTIPDDTLWFFGSGHPYRHIRITPWPVGAVAGFLKSDTLTQLADKEARFWVQGLLEEGVTATYGAVFEPYVQGYTRGDVLLDRFWTGRYTFAEAFAMATPTVRWAMCAVGDPLYKLKSE